MRSREINLEQTLAEHGYRCTAPRRQVLDIFLRAPRPLSATEVHKRLSRQNIDLVSVYRTVQLFCELEILESVDHTEQGQRYHLSDSYNVHHHHLVCQTCGKTQEFKECSVDQLVQKIFERTQFKVTKHELRFLGACSSCG